MDPDPPVGAVEFVVTASGEVLVVELLALFDPDEYHAGGGFDLWGECQCA